MPEGRRHSIRSGDLAIWATSLQAVTIANIPVSCRYSLIISVCQTHFMVNKLLNNNRSDLHAMMLQDSILTRFKRSVRIFLKESDDICTTWNPASI